MYREAKFLTDSNFVGIAWGKITSSQRHWCKVFGPIHWLVRWNTQSMKSLQICWSPGGASQDCWDSLSPFPWRFPWIWKDLISCEDTVNLIVFGGRVFFLCLLCIWSSFFEPWPVGLQFQVNPCKSCESMFMLNVVVVLVVVVDDDDDDVVVDVDVLLFCCC